VETPVCNTFPHDEKVKEVLPTFNEFHPLGRNGQAQDVTSAIFFLAGTPAERITGTVSPVDGGMNAGQHAR
jgi:NAD(P)-dependent dehydrogenase (short-subunit alcohol dehydrogenase family)